MWGKSNGANVCLATSGDAAAVAIAQAGCAGKEGLCDSTLAPVSNPLLPTKPTWNLPWSFVLDNTYCGGSLPSGGP